MEDQKRVATLDEACQRLGVTLAEELPFAEPKNGRQIAANGFVKCLIIAEALNQDEEGKPWQPDWADGNLKYYPWFWHNDPDASAGSRFSFAVIVYGYSGSRVGSRLVFKSRDLAIYAGKTFTKEYAEWMTIQ